MLALVERERGRLASVKLGIPSWSMMELEPIRYDARVLTGDHKSKHERLTTRLTFFYVA